MHDDHDPAAKARVVSLLKAYRQHLKPGLNLDDAADRFMDLAHKRRPEAARILAVRLSEIPVWYEEFAKDGKPAKISPARVEHEEAAKLVDRTPSP